MDDPNDPELRTPFERQLRAMVPLADRPDVDQFLFEAGKAAGRTTALRSYRRILAGLGLLYVVLVSANVFQQVTRHQAISALRHENLRLAQELSSANKPGGGLPARQLPQELIASLASRLRLEDSARSFEYAYVRLRDRLVQGDSYLQPLHEPSPSTNAVPHSFPSDVESSVLGRLQMQQQWLHGGPPNRGNAS